MPEYGNISHYSNVDDEDSNRPFVQAHYDATRRQYPQIGLTGSWELVKHYVPLADQWWWGWYEEVPDASN